MIPYIGGKSQIASWVIEHFPADYRRSTYVEVFGGAGWVLLKKDPSSNEVYNDLNEDLVNLFLMIRDRFDEFRERAEWTLQGRAIFEVARAKMKSRDFRDDVDRAIWYAITKTQSFAGHGNTYGYSIKPGSPTRGWSAFLGRLSLIRDRLLLVNIERLDFERLIKKYDSPTTFFYLDPPYVGAEGYYSVKFDEADHARLAETLRGIQGRFALSYYPHPLLKPLYKGFKTFTRTAVKSSYGVTRNSASDVRPRATEMLVTNYSPIQWPNGRPEPIKRRGTGKEAAASRSPATMPSPKFVKL